MRLFRSPRFDVPAADQESGKVAADRFWDDDQPPEEPQEKGRARRIAVITFLFWCAAAYLSVRWYMLPLVEVP